MLWHRLCGYLAVLIPGHRSFAQPANQYYVLICCTVPCSGTSSVQPLCSRSAIDVRCMMLWHRGDVLLQSFSCVYLLLCVCRCVCVCVCLRRFVLFVFCVGLFLIGHRFLGFIFRFRNSLLGFVFYVFGRAKHCVCVCVCGFFLCVCLFLIGNRFLGFIFRFRNSLLGVYFYAFGRAEHCVCV